MVTEDFEDSQVTEAAEYGDTLHIYKAPIRPSDVIEFPIRMENRTFGERIELGVNFTRMYLSLLKDHKEKGVLDELRQMDFDVICTGPLPTDKVLADAIGAPGIVSFIAYLPEQAITMVFKTPNQVSYALPLFYWRDLPQALSTISTVNKLFAFFHLTSTYFIAGLFYDRQMVDKEFRRKNSLLDNYHQQFGWGVSAPEGIVDST